ncbi:MAG: hypothetical protein VW232_08745 [Alphaproteobacteria bacterium]
MRQLILLRHAEADYLSEDGTDFSRPLSVRGQNELPMVASALQPYLSARIICLCSPALRTRQTFDIGTKYWPEMETIYDESLYNASQDRLFHAIDAIAQKADTVLVIGHNPGLSQLLRTLSPDSPADMPTSAAAILGQTAKADLFSNMSVLAFLTCSSLMPMEGAR